MSISIRLAQESDAEEMLAIYAPIVRDTAISFETTVPSTHDFRERIRSVLRRFPWIVCTAEGSLLGYAYATTFRVRAAYQWTVETTVYVHPDYRRRGVGRALYTTLLDTLRYQGFFRAVAVITLPNPPSVALHEALGFERMGVLPAAGYKHDAWHDVGYWTISLRPPDSAPAEIRPLGEVVATPFWKEATERGARYVHRNEPPNLLSRCPFSPGRTP